MFTKSTLILAAGVLLTAAASAQQVTLPLPRLLTMMPMGGQAGQSVEVTITGENIEDVTELNFSTPQITAKPVPGVVNKFTVSIAADAPAGVYDARVLSRLGVSSVRAFSVNKLPEVVRTNPNHTLETAMPLTVGSICNATMTKRAVDYYSPHSGADHRRWQGRGPEGEPHGRHDRLHTPCRRHLHHQGERPHLSGW
jgi:hypothetical protein